MSSEIDKKAQGQGCFIDLQKVFETLDHKILMSKPDSYGFRGTIHVNIRSYLSDRKQYISYNGTSMPCLSIETDVPQCSVFGLFLFLLYINDIILGESDCKVAPFTDDTTTIKAKREGCCSIQQEINRSSECFCANKLSISKDKCELISFGRYTLVNSVYWTKH